MQLSRPHITVDDLRVGWGSQVLMEHITFQVERGTIIAILGGSGSGKSSLLRYLIGLEQPQAGRIDIDGVGEPHRHEGVPPFGVLFQSGALFSSMTLAENLALPLTTWTSLRGVTVRELVQAKLSLVGLGPFAEHLPGEISGGSGRRRGYPRRPPTPPDMRFRIRRFLSTGPRLLAALASLVSCIVPPGVSMDTRGRLGTSGPSSHRRLSPIGETSAQTTQRARVTIHS